MEILPGSLFVCLLSAKFKYTVTEEKNSYNLLICISMQRDFLVCSILRQGVNEQGFLCLEKHRLFWRGIWQSAYGYIFRCQFLKRLVLSDQFNIAIIIAKYNRRGKNLYIRTKNATLPMICGFHF